MKLLLVISALVAVAAAFSADTVFSSLPESWYEEEANKAAQAADFGEIGSFVNNHDLAASFGDAKYGEPKNILQVAEANGASMFVRAAYFTKTADTFANTQGITVFVPSNAAFARLPREVLLYFLRHPDRLGGLLKLHALQGAMMIKDLQNDMTYKTLEKDIPIRYDAYTHVASNRTTRIIQASHINPRQVDFGASNGIVHIIDEVILALPLGTAYDVISPNPHFSTLYNALIVAGLSDTLKSAGPLTLFAPTEEAFKRLPAGVWEKILNDKTALTNVLDMHLVNRTYFARGFRDMDTISTLNKNAGLTVHIRRNGEENARGPAPPGIEVEVNDARIIYFDRAVTNGDLHAIDTVLLPPSVKAQFNL